MKLKILKKLFKYTCVASILFPAIGFCKMTDVSQCPVITPNDIQQVIDRGVVVSNPDATLLRQCIKYPGIQLTSGHYRAAFVVSFSEDNKIENVYYSDGKSPLQEVATNNQIIGIEQLIANLPPDDSFSGSETSLVFLTLDNLSTDYFTWETYKFPKHFYGQPLQEMNHNSATDEALQSITLPLPGQFTKGIRVSNEEENTKINGLITTALDDYAKHNSCQNCYMLHQFEENKTWALSFNDIDGNFKEIAITSVDGLQDALNKLPTDKFPEHMTYREVYNVEQIFKNYRATSLLSENDILACLKIQDGYYKLSDTNHVLGAKKNIGGSLYTIFLGTIISGNDNEARLRAKDIFLSPYINKMSEPITVSLNKKNNVCIYKPSVGRRFVNPHVISDSKKYSISVMPDGVGEDILNDAIANMQSDDRDKFVPPEDVKILKEILSAPII